MTLAYFLGGILFLWFGGEAFVRGSVAVAARLKVSQLMIGLTLVGFGTSLPELVTSVTAALAGAPGLSVGNVVGSNIANVLLIFAVAALVRPVSAPPEAFYRDAFALSVATLTGTAFIYFGFIGLVHGIILLAGLTGYIALLFFHEKRRPGPSGEVLVGEAQIVAPTPETLPRAIILVTAGMAGILGGAWLLVAGATVLATIWGVSKAFIGLTVVAVGTSLPELVITGIASLRGRSDVALGNIVGSNMFNILGVLGVTAIVAPIDVPPDVRLLDLLVMLAATLFLVVAAVSRMRVPRWQGFALLGTYAAFTAVRTSIAL